MNARDLEARPRPHLQPSVICVGDTRHVAYHPDLIHALARAAIERNAT